MSVHYDILRNYIVIHNVTANSVPIINPGERIVYFNTNIE